MAYSESPFSSTSSSYRHRWNYDVFLSFRGEDTRKQFTDHLYSALIQAGIHTFRDENALPRGEEISPQLLRAIEGSRISAVVFSKNYAFSRWCLEELVKIIECRQKTHQVVLPIFYDTDPSDVGEQTGSYAKAFDEHEEHFKEEMEKVNRWRDALAQAANLAGWGLNNDTNGYEAELIKRVVNDVACKLGNKTLHVAKHPVGICSRVQGVFSLLKGSRNHVGIGGIDGIVGIGKTTIAKAVFNDLYFGFEGSNFLSGVKEISDKPTGLVELQERLLHDIPKPNVWKISNIYEVMNFIKEQLHCKNVLVVFYDVNKREQLEALMGERCWFGDGSIIIVVTKNKHLLTEVEVDEMYHAMELDRDQSLQLFSLHAFRETCPAKDYEEIPEKVVDYYQGLPLAVKILGSQLFIRDKAGWKNGIANWRNILHDDIQGKLRISFDALDVDSSEIFLDIACFFVGKDKDYVADIVGARYGCHPEVAFRALIGRSLIRIDTENQNRLWMHDTVREMGREIIRLRSHNHPGNCSRIVLPKDAYTVLSKETSSDSEIQGIHITKYLISGEEDQRLLEQNNSSISFKTSEPWENSNHPLFLHHADQPGVVLVSQTLMEDNYTTWVLLMSMALTIKNKKGFVDGTLRRPTHNPNEQQQWDRCDILVRTWLLGSMSNDIVGSVIHCKDARGIWLELKDRFSQTNTVSLFHIENAIHDCEQGTNSVTTFFTKLKCLWDEKDALNSFPPCNCEAATMVKNFLETQKTIKFLMGLNESYAQTRSNIISMDPLPNLNKVYAMVLHHEKQAKTFTGKLTAPPEASAFAIKKLGPLCVCVCVVMYAFLCNVWQ